jgi:integrase/recombinase XerD
MTPLQQRMIEDIPLRGLSARTQDASVRAVRPLADHSHTSPAHLTEAALRASFLSLKHVQHSARRASTIALGGITFFSEHTLKRAGSPLTFVRAPREKKLPVLLSVEEVPTLLAPLTLLRSRACLTTLSSWGLRLPEGPHLHVPAMDRARMLVPVRHGNGATDRDVPLPQRPLALLRQDGKTPRHPRWLCPAPGRGGVGMSTASTPLPRSSVQHALRVARTPSGNNTRASVHTLRHRSATHGLEAGVTRRLIQDSVGHTTPPTTAISPQLTVQADALARQALTALMRHLCAAHEVSHGRVGRPLPTPWTRVARPLRRPSAPTPPGSHAG